MTVHQFFYDFYLCCHLSALALPDGSMIVTCSTSWTGNVLHLWIIPDLFLHIQGGKLISMIVNDGTMQTLRGTKIGKRGRNRNDWKTEGGGIIKGTEWNSNGIRTSINPRNDLVIDSMTSSEDMQIFLTAWSGSMLHEYEYPSVPMAPSSMLPLLDWFWLAWHGINSHWRGGRDT